jgi:hypothetical protein
MDIISIGADSQNYRSMFPPSTYSGLELAQSNPAYREKLGLSTERKAIIQAVSCPLAHCRREIPGHAIW